jgi:hypothetical protein
MEASDHWKLNHPPPFRRLDRSLDGGVLTQGTMSPRSVVIVQAFDHQSSKMPLIDYDHPVQALATNAPDQTFGDRVLPRRPGGNHLLLDPLGMILQEGPPSLVGRPSAGRPILPHGRDGLSVDKTPRPHRTRCLELQSDPRSSIDDCPLAIRYAKLSAMMKAILSGLWATIRTLFASRAALMIDRSSTAPRVLAKGRVVACRYLSPRKVESSP